MKTSDLILILYMKEFEIYSCQGSKPRIHCLFVQYLNAQTVTWIQMQNILFVFIKIPSHNGLTAFRLTLILVTQIYSASYWSRVYLQQNTFLWLLSWLHLWTMNDSSQIWRKLHLHTMCSREFLAGMNFKRIDKPSSQSKPEPQDGVSNHTLPTTLLLYKNRVYFQNNILRWKRNMDLSYYKTGEKITF